jgi:tetratricopeptide (TPR) repeat protein
LEDWHDDDGRPLAEKRFRDAREEIQDMMKEYPESWEPLFLMGTCLAVEGKPDQAIPILTRVISRHPSPEAYNNLGSAHKALIHIEEWVDCLKKVIELDGKRGEYGRSAKADLDAFASQIQKIEGVTLDRYLENQRRYAQAFAHLKAGRFETAIQGFTDVLKVAPRNVQSYGNIGLAYAGLGDRDRAIAHLDKAIQLDPNYQPAIDNRRILLASPAGERLNPDAVREIHFYADQARAESRQTQDIHGQQKGHGV